jgi:hypothetical protein
VHSDHQNPEPRDKLQRRAFVGKINHVQVETTQNKDQVLIGTLLANSVPATVLFDPYATHSFIAAQFARRRGIFKCPTKMKMHIQSPGQTLSSHHICPDVGTEVGGTKFMVNLIEIELSGIDIILGADTFISQKIHNPTIQANGVSMDPDGRKS